jgi:hypothetical protein
VIVHATVVVPTANELPEAGAHAIVTGCAAPDTCGSPKVIVTGWPEGDCIVTGAGHTPATCDTSLGAVDEPCVHAAARIAGAATHASRIRKLIQ